MFLYKEYGDVKMTNSSFDDFVARNLLTTGLAQWLVQTELDNETEKSWLPNKSKLRFSCPCCDEYDEEPMMFDESTETSSGVKKNIAQVNIEPGTTKLDERVMCLDCAWQEFEETGQRFASAPRLFHRIQEILWVGNDPIRQELLKIKDSRLTCAYTNEPVLGHNAYVVSCEAIEILLGNTREEVFELVRNGYAKPSSVKEFENLSEQEQKRLFLLKLAGQVSHGPKVDPRGYPNVVSNSVRKEVEEEFPVSVVNQVGEKRNLFQRMQGLFLHWLKQQGEFELPQQSSSPLTKLFFR